MDVVEKINILVIQEKPQESPPLEQILNDDDFQIYQTSSAEEGINMLLENNFALIMQDVAAPEMEGYKTARRIRDNEKIRHIPMVFMTPPLENSSDMFSEDEYGAIDYIFKPINPKILKSKVRVFKDFFEQKKMLETKEFALEQKMSELATVLLKLQGKEKLLEKQTVELKNANQELNDFASIVSHDLKAPLRAIGSLASWISTDYAGQFDDEGREQMSMLVARVKRMHELIDGILQYSRVGRIREKMVDIDLNKIVEEVLDMIVPPENIKITVENNLPTIHCERVRITQVFQNFLSNAIKYMDKPEGKIIIGCEDDGKFWKFHFKDNGPGIEEKYYNRIFQIFQTLNPRDKVESTGVGLTLIKKIVEMYGGQVWVESVYGEGSVFYFKFPKQHQEQTKEGCKF